MKYHVKETGHTGLVEKTAGGKARADAEAIFEEIGLKKLRIPSIDDRENPEKFIIKKLLKHYKTKKAWKARTAKLNKGDVVFVQFPLLEHSIFLKPVFKTLSKKGVRVYLLIHDLEYIRISGRADVGFMKRKRLAMEEQILRTVTGVIVHNKAMKKYLIGLGYDENKLIDLEIFDYLIPDYDEEKINERPNEKDMGVIVAGSLHPKKSRYIYNAPETLKLNLFGINYDDRGLKNHNYKGSFMPDELPFVLEGSFGLVWDGDTADTCSGVYGEYLRLNNPHKTSLYLASSIPVIIWDQAALADFVEENGCGIKVSSLQEIPGILSNMSEDKYRELTEGAKAVSERLRAGYYTKKAVNQCMELK